MCTKNRCIIPLIISVILGSIIGALFFTGTIAAATILTPIIFATVFAAISLILLFIIAAFAIKREVRECICEFGKCLAVGGIVTLIIGFILLAAIASIVAESIISAILVGLGAFGFILTFLSFIGLLFCLIRSNCMRAHECCKFDNDYNK